MNELGKKIFVSYKYKDNDVKMMPNVTQPTWPCDYVDYIKDKVLCDDDIYKGEKSDEDISSWSEDAIWNHLKNKIYDSTLTIVLISPNMKETGNKKPVQAFDTLVRHQTPDIGLCFLFLLPHFQDIYRLFYL